MGYQDFSEVLPGPESADFDIGLAPAGDLGGLADGAFLQFAEGEDPVVFGGERSHGASEDFAGLGVLKGCGGGWVGEFKGEGVEGSVFPVATFFPEKIKAGGSGNPGKPVGERGVAAEFAEVFVESEKDFLGEILELVLVTGVPGCRSKHAVLLFSDQVGEGGIGAP